MKFKRRFDREAQVCSNPFVNGVKLPLGKTKERLNFIAIMKILCGLVLSLFLSVTLGLSKNKAILED